MHKNIPADNVNTNANTNTDNYPEISIQEYRHNKRRLIAEEQDNFCKIIAIPCSGNKNWYEIAEHSALIYYYDVCHRFNLGTKLHVDAHSYYVQYLIGFIRNKGVDDFRANLKKAKLYQSEEQKGNSYHFILNHSYTEDQITEFNTKERQRRVDLLTPITTHNLNPELHYLITNLASRLHNLCNSRLDRLSSQVNGAEIIRLIDHIQENYLWVTMISNPKSPKLKQKYQEMRHDIYTLIIKIKVLSNLKLWNLEICASLTDSLNPIRDIIDQTLKNLIKTEKDNQ